MTKRAQKNVYNVGWGENAMALFKIELNCGLELAPS